jgi:hypothetical protein
MIVGEPEQRARPWGTVFRLELDDGSVAWSKANGPGPSYEGRVLAILAARGESVALQPLASDLDRAWLLLPDGGATLRAHERDDGRPADQDPLRWIGLLPAYAAFQRRTTEAVDALLAAGVPDERPRRYPAILEQLVDVDGLWTRVDEPERATSDETRRRLADLAGLVQDLAGELESSPVAVSLDHGDLHGNNVLPDASNGPRIFDWGDAVVAHPFATLTSTLGSIGYHAGLDPYGPGVADVRDAYVAAWADVAPIEALRADATLAMDLGHIGKAAAFERALTGLEPGEMGGFHNDTARWLRDLVSRLERR